MKIETFSTGGGIWLVEVELEHTGDYAVVSSECPEVLSLYHNPADGKEKYLPEDMYLSKPWDELDAELAMLHTTMCLELQIRGIISK